jgi:hypothetical protein
LTGVVVRALDGVTEELTIVKLVVGLDETLSLKLLTLGNY